MTGRVLIHNRVVVAVGVSVLGYRAVLVAKIGVLTCKAAYAGIVMSCT